MFPVLNPLTIMKNSHYAWDFLVKIKLFFNYNTPETKYL